MGFLQLFGITALAKAIEDSIQAARTPGEYWVGSAVPYGPFHEFGTRSLTERSHWRPALQKIAAEHGGSGGFSSDIKSQELINEMITVPRGLVKKIAFEIEREVKIIITQKQIIDTGNYKGSIATGPSESEAYATSAARSTI